MKHLLNKDFYQIAKDYAVNNPKMDAQTCFKRADEFLEEYRKIIKINGNDAVESYNSNSFPDGYELKNNYDVIKKAKSNVYMSLIYKYRSLQNDNFDYLSDFQIIDTLNPQIDF